MAKSLDAAAQAATPTRDGTTPALRRRLLLLALEKGGSGCATLLRRWAREGRPYRGQVFSSAEVEAAIEAAKVLPAAAKQTPADAREPAVHAKEAKVEQGNRQIAVKASEDKRADAVDNGSAGSKVHASSHSGTGGSSSSTAGSSSSQAGSHEAGRSRNERMVSLNTKNWPTEAVLEGAVSVTSSLGPIRPELAKGSARAALLKALYDPAPLRKGHAKHADVQVATDNPGRSVGAHRAILGAVSEVLRCKFGGNYGDTLDNTVDAANFSYNTVHAAIEFAYLGSCQIQLSDLGTMVALADYLQFSELATAAEKCWMSLPIVCCLEVLAGLKQDANVPRAMVDALVRSLSANFSRVAELLTGQAASPDKIPACWRFVQELHNWLVQLSDDAMERFRFWVGLENDELHDATESFTLAVIRKASDAANASTTNCDEMRWICNRQFKAFLPEAMLGRILTQLMKNWPAYKLDWFYSGGPNLRVMFDFYSQLRSHVNAHDEEARAQVARGELPPEAIQLQDQHADFQKGFGLAFVEEAYISGSSFWETLLRRGLLEERLPAVEHALQVFAQHVLRGRSLPSRLPVTVVLHVLLHALTVAPALAVQVNGPDTLAGVYQQKAKRNVYVRQGSGPALVLRRVARATRLDDEREAINIVWKGIPADDSRKARAEWKVQKVEDDENFDAPLAVALSASEDPCKLGVPWYIGNSNGRFKENTSMEIRLESIREEEAAACAAVLASWSRSGGSLADLEEEALSRYSDEVALPKLCRAASALLAKRTKLSDDDEVATATKAPETALAEESVTPAREESRSEKEENDPEWQEAVQAYDAAVDELCNMLREVSRAESAEEKRRLLEKKRRLEEAPAFIAAVRRLERAGPAEPS